VQQARQKGKQAAPDPAGLCSKNINTRQADSTTKPAPQRENFEIEKTEKKRWTEKAGVGVQIKEREACGQTDVGQQHA
jgi:hypothetical protein